MLKAMILICHAALAPADCTPVTAADVLQGPQARDANGCLFQGMAYAAEVGFRMDGHYAKIVCVRGK